MDHIAGRDAESYDGKHEAIRLYLQQQVVHRHVNDPVPQQERFIRGENQEIASDPLLSRVHRYAASPPTALNFRDLSGTGFFRKSPSLFFSRYTLLS